MSTDSDDGFEAIARHFSSLLHALKHNGDKERPPEMRDMLVDRLRDALDRRLPHLSSNDPAFIAGSFAIEDVIHRGERTEVIRLRHRDLGTLHALKTVTIDHRDDAVARRLLLREAQIGMALHHPNLVRYQLPLRLTDGRPAVVMEWAGESLSARPVDGSVSISDVMDGMIALLLALEAIHAAGYVHCDISPGNLLLSGNGYRHLKIADFGVALEQGQHHRDIDITKAATPFFTAPELSEGGQADLRSDLYSAGCVMNGLLDRCDGLPDEVEALRALARHLSVSDPSLRPESAAAALALLGR